MDNGERRGFFFASRYRPLQEGDNSFAATKKKHPTKTVNICSFLVPSNEFILVDLDKA